jgi:PIN domain nuclease of toxin-antitoxin system
MIVLDTHIWIRWVDNCSDPLPLGIVERIEMADAIAISAVSCWEIALLVRRNRVQLKLEFDQWLENGLAGSGVSCLPVDRGIAVLAANLPEHHRDPADRLIIATAVMHNAQLISLDQAFQLYTELSGFLIKS